jgi:TrmH family RNA methyltransferase
VVYATTDYKRPNNVDCVEITADELRKLSFLQHPQQVLAVFYMPRLNEIPEPQGLCLALDGVQDPGNLGTIIRIADWFGIETIYCSQDTADAWNPKVVQATMGSIARVNIVYTQLKELLKKSSLPIYGTLLDGENVYSKNLSADGIIVMGNEGNGISADVREIVTEKLLIPSYRNGDTAESLNVAIATAIICAEFRRRR